MQALDEGSIALTKNSRLKDCNMLTSDLVRVRVRNNNIHLPYINEDDQDNLAVAEKLIDIFKSNKNGTRQELDEELSDTTSSGPNFIFYRGLSKLLKDRSEFVSDSPIPPVELRRRIFKYSAAVYRDRTKLFINRQAILKNVGKTFSIDSEGIDNAFYADLKQVERLQNFQPCAPKWLLSRYNVALVQAVLFRASEFDLVIEGETPARYQNRFRKIKFFRLLHEIKKVGTRKYHVHIDGPMALFKSSQRYGLQIAQFFPTILHSSKWEITASIIWGNKRRECNFQLDSIRNLKPINHLTGQWMPEEIGWLKERFTQLKSNWQIAASKEIIDLGSQGILTPDYIFSNDLTGTQVYLDFLGYWRSQGLQNRLKLVKANGPQNIILAVSEALGIDKEVSDEFPGEIYEYRRTPVAQDILKILEAREIDWAK